MSFFKPYFMLHWVTLISVLMSPWVSLTAGMSATSNECYYYGVGSDWLSIAFQVYDPDSNNWDIYTTSLCSLQYRIRLTTSPAFDGFPRWNGDATRLVFVSNRDGNDEIYTMLADGTGVKRLTDHPAIDTAPTFSPDGTRIAFVSERDGNPEIYLMNTDGSGLLQLTMNSRQNFDPDWSPDGHLIAWTQGDEISRQVYVMNLDGSNPHPISQPLHNARRPVWSPKGDRLALEADDNQDGWQDLLEISADGTGSRVLPIAKTVTSTYGEDFLMGAWSMDGSILYFTRAIYSVSVEKRLLQKTELTKFSDGQIYGIGPSGSLSFYPAVRSRDPYPPITTLDPIPEYFRAGYQSIHWTIQDPGPSGLDSYKLESFAQPDGPWTDANIYCPTITQADPSFWSNTCYFSYYYTGQEIIFRLRAVDKAGNSTISPAQVQGTPYSLQSIGRVLDSRGYPLASATVDANHAVHKMLTGQQGDTSLYFQDTGPAKATFSKLSYGSYPSQTWLLNNNNRFLAVLPPVENLLVNGDFESAEAVAAGWQTSGNLPVQPGVGLSGDRAVILGKPYDHQLCFSPLELLPSYNGSLSFVTDSEGVTHFLAPTQNGVDYYERSQDGIWSTPEAYPLIGYPSNIQISSTGTLYFIYIDKDTQTYSLASKPINGHWSFVPVILPDATAAARVLAYTYDGQEQFHAIYRHSDVEPAIHYIRRRADQSWTSPMDLPLDPALTLAMLLTSDPGGKIHLIYETTYSPVYFDSHPWYVSYAQITPDGSLAAPQKLPLWEYGSGYGDYSAATLIASASGEIHFLAKDTYHNRAVYWRRTVNGTWMNPEVIYKQWARDFTLLVGARDEAHIFAEDPWGNGVAYFYKSADDNPFVQSIVDIGFQYQRFVMSLDERGQPQFAANGYFTHLVPQELTGEVTLHQTVPIPDRLNSPTLSFRYRLEQEFPGVLSGMEVTLTPDGGAPVRLFTSGKERGSWLHGWADLSAWAGQTVTIAFRLSQAADEWNARLSLDEVSLGSWNSPVIQSVSPQVLTPPEAVSAILHLSGINLSAQAQVLIGTHVSPAVNVDSVSGDLLVTLPPDLKPGIYPIHVLYPDGRDAFAPFPLRLGYFFYSPILSR